ncbi:MAG: SWIM zinc finger family protein, partial [Kineosporiaceae bacterium]
MERVREGTSVAVLTMTGPEITVHEAAGTRAFLMAREHLRRGEVHDLQGSLSHGHLQGRVGSGRDAHTALALLRRDPDGATASVSGSCTCGTGPLCRHATAVLLAALPGTSAAAVAE